MSSPFVIEYVGKRPEFGSEFAAGYDLIANAEVTFNFGHIEVVPVDLVTAFPSDKMAVCIEKSSMAIYGFDVKAGLIDSDYRKGWGVVLRYLPSFQVIDGKIHLTAVRNPLTGVMIESNETFTVKAGQKLCNMVIFDNPGRDAQWKNRQNIADLPAAKRTGGFGSTGA